MQVSVGGSIYKGGLRACPPKRILNFRVAVVPYPGFSRGISRVSKPLAIYTYCDFKLYFNHGKIKI